MSNLRYMTIVELKEEIKDIEKYINNLKNKISGQQERLAWAKHYLFEKTPQEMTWQEMEQKLGHKVIIKRKGE